MLFRILTVSSSSFLLLERHHAFMTKRLGSEDLCGSLLSLAHGPAWQTHICLFPLCRLCRQLARIVILGYPDGLTSSDGMSWSKIQLLDIRLIASSIFLKIK